MKTKKGYLVILNAQKKYNFELSVCNGDICNDSKEFYEYYKNLPYEDQAALNHYFTYEAGVDSSKIDDPRIKKLLFDFCKKKLANYRNVVPFFYEEIEDKDGNKYGREIKWKYVFPIPKEAIGSFTINNTKKVDNVFYNSENYQEDDCTPFPTIFYPHGLDMMNFNRKFVNKEGKKYYATIRAKKTSYKVYKSYNAAIYSGYEPIYLLRKTSLDRFKISMSIDFVHDNMDRIEVVLLENGFANKREIELYNDKPKREYLGNLFKLNVFKDEIVYQESKEKNNSSILTLINNIEATLLRIREINEDLFKELNNEYNKLMGSNDYKTNSKESDLKDFYDSIKDKRFLSDSPVASIKILDDYISKIINNLKEGVDPNIYLPYLTKLHDEIIDYQNRYELADIKLVNERMNMLYFLFLYANKSLFDIPENTSYLDIPFYKEITSNTYIKDNVVGILNVIQQLLDKRMIEENNLITYHKVDCFYKPESTNLPHLLDFISDINIIDIDKTKELIKR